jgi:hypothetical protein
MSKLIPLSDCLNKQKFESLSEEDKDLFRKRATELFNQRLSSKEAHVRAAREMQDKFLDDISSIHKQIGISSPKTENDGKKTEAKKTEKTDELTSETKVVNEVSEGRLGDKPIFTDFDGTIVDNDTGKLTPWGQEVQDRIKGGEDVHIVTHSKDEEGQPAGSNKERIRKALGLTPEEAARIKIDDNLSPDEKIKIAKEGGGVLVDNTDSILSKAKESGLSEENVIDAKKLNRQKPNRVVYSKNAGFRLKSTGGGLKPKQNAEKISSDQGQVHPERGEQPVVQNAGGENIQRDQETGPEAGNQKKQVENRRGIIRKANNIESLTDPRDRVLQWFTGGGKIHSDVVKELFRKSEGEKRSRIGLLSKKGSTIDQLAHTLWESDASEHGGEALHDTQDYRDAIEQVLQEHVSSGSMATELVEKYIDNLPQAYMDLPPEEKGQVATLSFEMSDNIADIINNEKITLDNIDSPHIKVLFDELFYTPEEYQAVKDYLAGQDKSVPGDTSASAGSKEPPKGPPPEEPQIREPKEDPKEEWTSVNKDKNAEVEGAKELFDQQKTIKWSDTYENALRNVQAMYPGENLYDAMKSRVNYFLSQLDNKILFNPTSEDNAVFNVFKLQTLKKMGEIQGWDSPDDIQRQQAVLRFADFQNDLLNVVKVTNPGGEAGRAFNILQSEISNSPDHGLQIRRMELLKSKGEPLSEEDMEFTAEQWQKDQDIAKQQQDLEKQAMQDRFERELNKVKEQLKQAQSERAPKPPGKKFDKAKAKSVAQSLKNFADKFEKFGRADLPEGTQKASLAPDIQKMVADGIRWVADKIEKGDIRIPDIIAAAVDRFGGKDSAELTKHIHQAMADAGIDQEVFAGRTQKEISLEKIQKFAEENKVSSVTNEMVGKNLIRDYINAHVGLHDAKDVMDKAFNDLKKVLPDLEKSKLMEAYLKENEFKQPTKKQLVDSLESAKKQLQNITRLEEDIADLRGYKEVRQRNFPSERERIEYEKKLAAEKEGILKERQEAKAQADKEYRDLEGERNRQLKRVQELKAKKAQLEKGIREKREVNKKTDTPEIENLKKQVAEADKKLREAEGEVKRINREADRKTAKITQYNYEIQRLKERGELSKRGKAKSNTEIDKDIAAKQKQLEDTMRSMGIKPASGDKYTKASYDQRAKIHNERLDNIVKLIQDKLDNPDISEADKKNLLKLKGQLEASKIKLDPTSALSQEKVLQGGLDILKSVKSEFSRNADARTSGDINTELQRAIDRFASDKQKTDQEAKLERAKAKAIRDKNEFKRKINAEEFDDNPPTPLLKKDAKLIKLQRDRDLIADEFNRRKREYEKGNMPTRKKAANILRALNVTFLIGKPFTLAKVAASAFIKPQLETATKLTAGKAFSALPFETTKAITERAKAGGESLSIKSIQKGYEAFFRQYKPEQLAKLYETANDKFEKSDIAYQKMLADPDANPEELQKLKNQRNNDLVDAIGNTMYQFIGGSSIAEAGEVLLHRSTELERQFGDFSREQWDSKGAENWAKGINKKTLTDIDNIDYLLNFVGRSHAALKNFSARYSFAAGFMARIEAAAADGTISSNPDRILELAHESYIDWDRGKYQESNWVSDTWNKVTAAVEEASPELAYLMRADIAITRVPVNMIREGIMEYTLGAFTGSVKAAMEYYKARGIVLNHGYTPEVEGEFKKALSEQLQKIDPDTAATILRSFRKGGFGLGMYALALFGMAKFGGWAHKGMTAEDKEKKKRELLTGVPEIKTEGLQIGDLQVPPPVAKIIEHTPAFAPLGFGLGLGQVYKNNIINGKSTEESAFNSAKAQVDHIVGSIPQAELVTMLAQPIAQRTIQMTTNNGQWEDVSKTGDTLTRKAFHIEDYVTHLTNPKGVLSEKYYKAAVKTQKEYRDQITQIELNTSLTKKEKEDLRQKYLDAMKQDIDNIYQLNKLQPE